MLYKFVQSPCPQQSPTVLRRKPWLWRWKAWGWYCFRVFTSWLGTSWNNRHILDLMGIGWRRYQLTYLVGGLDHFLFSPYIGNNHPNWLIFFRGVQTTNQTYICCTLGASTTTNWTTCWSIHEHITKLRIWSWTAAVSAEQWALKTLKCLPLRTAKVGPRVGTDLAHSTSAQLRARCSHAAAHYKQREQPPSCKGKGMKRNYVSRCFKFQWFSCTDQGSTHDFLNRLEGIFAECRRPPNIA